MASHLYLKFAYIVLLVVDDKGGEIYKLICLLSLMIAITDADMFAITNDDMVAITDVEMVAITDVDMVAITDAMIRPYLHQQEIYDCHMPCIKISNKNLHRTN